MTRIAAHRITYEGVDYDMSVIELADDGHTVNIFTLTEEIHSTRFISGHIEVTLTPAGTLAVKSLK